MPECDRVRESLIENAGSESGHIATGGGIGPYGTILGEPLGPENCGALGSIKESQWALKWRAFGS